MLCCISTPVYWNALCKPCFVCENLTAINTRTQSSLLTMKSVTRKNYLTKLRRVCFVLKTRHKTRVSFTMTQSFETQSFLRRLFNASISTADVIMTREGDCGVYCNTIVGRDCIVGISSRYGLDGTRIKSRWGRDFPHPSRPALGPTHPHYSGYQVFPGGKVAGAWR
jgi:hypothetical protein